MEISDEPSTVGCLPEMEGTESTNAARTTGANGNQETNSSVLMTSKPLHRFVQKEPRSLGIIILMFGCAELLMGFQLAGQDMRTSNGIYIPFWQGVLFLTCGILSIYTELHPSKKMVTVCLAMYVVSILGNMVSFGYRLFCFIVYSSHWYWSSFSDHDWDRLTLLTGVEGILFTSSLCVSALLFFLSSIARFALKSTHTQVIVQHIPPPRRETTLN